MTLMQSIIVDINPSMKSYSENNQTYGIENACDLIQELIWIHLNNAKKKDRFHVLAVGGQDNNESQDYLVRGNDVLELFPGNEQPESCAVDQLTRVPEKLKLLAGMTREDMKQVNNKIIDLIPAMQISCNCIGEITKALKYNREMIVITNGMSIQDLAGIERIVGTFPNITFKFMLIDIANADYTQQEHRRELTRVLDKLACNSEQVEYFNFQQAKNNMLLAHVKSVEGVVGFSGLLDMGNSNGFEVQVFTKTKEQSAPTLSKFCLEQGGSFSDMKTEKKMRNAADPLKEINEEDIGFGFWYGGHVIPLNDSEVTGKKYPTGERNLKVLGYIPKDKFPISNSMSHVSYVVPKPGFRKSASGFAAFVQALIRRDRVCVARYVSRANSSLKVVVLSPYYSEKENIQCLIMWNAPFVEDDRSFQNDPLPESLYASEKQLEVMETFVDSLSIESPNPTSVKSEYAPSSSSFTPENLLNPMLERYFQLQKYRGTYGDDAVIPESLFEMKQYYSQDPEFFTTRHSVYEDINSEFTLKVVEPKSGTFAMKSSSEGHDDDGQFKVEPKMEPVDASVNWITEIANAGKRVQTVSHEQPLSDFTTMIGYDDEQMTTKAIQSMCGVIKDFAQDKENTKYSVAIDCVVELRKACIMTQSEKIFNKFLVELKGAVKVESVFWNDYFVTARTSLIYETANSKITKEESDQFLTSTNIQQDEQVTFEAPTFAEDDAFDNFE